MIESHWFALGGFSMLMTLGWLFVEERVTTTAALAAGGWAYMALTADSLVRYTDTGTEIAVSAGSLAYFCTALALLSLLALLLYRFGLYPPQEDDPESAGGAYT